MVVTPITGQVIAAPCQQGMKSNLILPAKIKGAAI
jgi:hypothetical protein